MLDPTDIDAAAQALDRAERDGVAIAPLTAKYPGLDERDAYAIQSAWIRLKMAAGRKVRGQKIGLTSRAMQRMVDWGEPDYGVLLDDMIFEDGADLSSDRFITPMVECELAFVLDKPLRGPDVSVVDVLSATAYVLPAMEIIDLRTLAADPTTGSARRVLDNIADNAAAAAVVLGGRPVGPDAVDLRWVAAVCRRGGVIEQTGVAAAVLNHPARGVAWLANKLAPHGVGIEPGQVVMGGSFTGVVPARRGDVFQVDYGPLGIVSCSFV